MIESVLKEIRDAEQKAEQLQKDAYQRGKEIVLNAEAEAEAQKRATVRECKDERKEALQEARRLALEDEQNVLKKGMDDATLMEENKNPEIEATAHKVVRMLLEKYVGDFEGGAEKADTKAEENTDAE